LPLPATASHRPTTNWTTTMTLFAALTSTSSSSSSTSGTSPSSCYPPEAIQLYSNLSIDFLSGTTRSLDVRHDAAGRSDATASNANNDANDNNTDASSRYFSMLSYQAVQVDGIKANGSGNNDHSRPDLGVWDCRVLLPESSRRSTTTSSPADDGGASAASTVLRRVVVDGRRRRPGAPTTAAGENSNSGEEKKDDDTAGDNRESNAPSPSIVRTVVLAVDLSDPTRVQPTLERMRRVVVDTYRDLPPSRDDATPAGAHATSVDALARTAFGSARIVDRRPDETGPRIALLLAAILPRSDDAAARDESPAHEYQRRQTRALILYHLHKFAWEVDAALCFVGEGGDDDRAFLLGRNSAVSVDRFADVVRRVASGAPPSDDEEDLAVGVGGATSSRSDGNDDAVDAAASTAPKPLPAVHPSGTHDAELIHGAYLRNASCEGKWDAARDDLIQALPPLPTGPRCVDDDPTSSGDDGDEESPSSSKGDEEFLSKLASSVGIDPESLSSSSYDTGVVGSPAKSAVGSGREGAATEGGEGMAGNAKASADKKALLKKKSARIGAGGAVKKDQKEVSSFFESLLKK